MPKSVMKPTSEATLRPPPPSADGQDAADQRQGQVHQHDERVAVAAEGEEQQRRTCRRGRPTARQAEVPHAARGLLELPAEDDPVALGQRQPVARAPRAPSRPCPSRSAPATLAVSIARRCTFSRRTRPGPEVEADARHVAEPDHVARPASSRAARSSSSRSARSRSGKRTTTREVRPPSTISPAARALEQRLHRPRQVRRREPVARHGLAVEVDRAAAAPSPAPGC